VDENGGSPDAPEIRVGGRFGVYRILALLGRGPSGSVYLAEHEILGQRTVLRVPELDRPGDRDRFLATARALARLRHPNLVGLKSLGEGDGGRLYLEVEFVEGRTLHEVLQAGGGLQAPVALRLARDLAGVLEYLHDFGVLLLTLSPGNVLISDSGEALVIDISFAVAADSGQVSAAEIAGSDSPFFAPEIKGPDRSNPGPAADVWSLGAVLQAMLAGPGESTDSGADLSEVTRPIVSRCMASDPGERSTAAEARASLEAVLDSMDRVLAGVGTPVSPRVGEPLLLHTEHPQSKVRGDYLLYEVEAYLGGGAFGETYRAKEVGTGRISALKLLRRQWLAQDDVVARFRREASILMRISHPGVTKVRGFGRYGGSYYIAMELLVGETLEAVLAALPRLPLGEAVKHGKDLASALAAVHSAGVVHRDLKPANVMVCNDRTVLFDFGVSHDAGAERMTFTGQALGTPLYMAPEQAAGEAVDASADAYALGAVLYEMLAGQPAFQATSFGELLTHKLSGPSEPLDRLRADVPDALAALVTSLLEVEPAHRPSAQAAYEVLAKLSDAAPRNDSGGTAHGE